MKEKRNVVLIVWHDLGRHLGCYGVKRDISPNVDCMAREGILYRQHFSVGSVCVPSRCGILTGKYPTESRLWQCLDSDVTLPMLFRRAGYRTARFGFREEEEFFSVRPNPDLPLFARTVLGYDNSFGDGEKDSAWIAGSVCRFLNENRENRFFLNIEFPEVHSPYETAFSLTDVQNVTLPQQLPFLLDTFEARCLTAGFEQKIRRADKAVGEILKCLKENNLVEDTLVVFTTDHGIDFPRAKMTLYDPGIEAALVFWGANCPAGRTDNDLHSHVDLLPTLLEYAGLEIPAGIQGKSFWKSAGPAKRYKRDCIFAQRAWETTDKKADAVRTKRYKCIFHHNVGQTLPLPPGYMEVVGSRVFSDEIQTVLPAVELYDLQSDPYELHNLAGAKGYGGVLREMERIRKQELGNE